MKIKIGKIILIMALGIFVFSGVMGKVNPNQFQVKTIKVINEIKDHTALVILNQEARGPAIEVSGSERTITTKAIVISQIRLILRDQMDILEYFDNKEVHIDLMDRQVELDMGKGVKITLKIVGPATVNIIVSRR